MIFKLFSFFFAAENTEKNLSKANTSRYKQKNILTPGSHGLSPI